MVLVIVVVVVVLVVVVLVVLALVVVNSKEDHKRVECVLLVSIYKPPTIAGSTTTGAATSASIGEFAPTNVDCASAGAGATTRKFGPNRNTSAFERRKAAVSSLTAFSVSADDATISISWEFACPCKTILSAAEFFGLFRARRKPDAGSPANVCTKLLSCAKLLSSRFSFSASILASMCLSWYSAIFKPAFAVGFSVVVVVVVVVFVSAVGALVSVDKTVDAGKADAAGVAGVAGKAAIAAGAVEFLAFRNLLKSFKLIRTLSFPSSTTGRSSAGKFFAKCLANRCRRSSDEAAGLGFRDIFLVVAGVDVVVVVIVVVVVVVDVVVEAVAAAVVKVSETAAEFAFAVAFVLVRLGVRATILVAETVGAVPRLIETFFRSNKRFAS